MFVLVGYFDAYIYVQGTLHYMSPERINAQEPCKPSDKYVARAREWYIGCRYSNMYDTNVLTDGMCTRWAL